MKTPKILQPLIDDGLIDEVILQLKSGKEATVYLVQCGESMRCAKVYKDAQQRSFKNASVYREGRKVKNSRDARAMEKGTKFGKHQQEETWQNSEVNSLFRLADAGVRVPKPYGCYDGILLMDMVSDLFGNPAPRLSEVEFTPEMALACHNELIREVVRMLCAGIVHGDLSEYNILMDPLGPVIIDLPQAVDASANVHAFTMLARDIQNLKDFFAPFAPELNDMHYAGEIWRLYEQGELTPTTPLTGHFIPDEHEADLEAILAEIEDAKAEAKRRAMALHGQSDRDEFLMEYTP